MASIQTGAALAKQLFPITGPLGTATLRLVIAAIILVPAFRAWRLRPQRWAWRSILFYGVALGGMNSLFYASIAHIPLGIAVALEFTGPLAVALLGSRRRTDFAWIILAAAGLFFLLPIRSVDRGALDLAGCLFALGAGVCWALYIVFGKKAGIEHGIRTTALGMAVAALLVLPIGIGQISTAVLTPKVFLLAGAVAVLSSALPYSLEMISLRRLKTRTFGTLMSLEPALAALSGVILLGERLSLAQSVAVGAVIAASLGTVLTAEEREEDPPITSDPTVGDVESPSPAELRRTVDVRQLPTR